MTLTPAAGAPLRVTRTDKGAVNGVLIAAPWLLPPFMARVYPFDSVKFSGEFVAPGTVAVTV